MNQKQFQNMVELNKNKTHFIKAQEDKKLLYHLKKQAQINFLLKKDYSELNQTIKILDSRINMYI